MTGDRQPAVVVPELGVLLVDLQVAARFASLARRGAAEATRVTGWPLHGPLQAVVEAFDLAAQLAGQAAPEPPPLAASSGDTGQVPAVVPPLDGVGSGQPRSGRVMVHAGEVARRVGVTVRAVRKAAQTGRLAGHLDQRGRWTFTEQAISGWQTSRRRDRSA
jgi:hypothetical protein